MSRPRDHHLSARGCVYAAPSSKVPMLDVVSDLWHPERNPGGYVSLGVAENTLMHEEILQHMKDNFDIDSHSLTYGDGFSGSHPLRETVARFVTHHFKAVDPVTKSQIIITNGVGPAIEQFGFSICDPGDGVLLARPFYGSFPVDLSYRAGVKVRGVSFGDADPFGLDTIEAYEAALENAEFMGIRVRALLLCNPHNPLGRCYPENVLKAYMRFCHKHRIHLISDEIYALSVWKNPDAPEAPGFTSVLSIPNDGLIDPSLLHVLWGMSKDFGSNGIRLGCVISQANEGLLRAIEANAYFACPSALTDLATRRILADDAFVQSFVQTNQLRIAENYIITARFLESHDIPYEKGANAGFFIWVDLFSTIRQLVDRVAEREADDKDVLQPALWSLEARLQETLLRHRIFLASGKAFGGTAPGWFRIVFAHEKSYLARGLDRVVLALRAFGEELAKQNVGEETRNPTDANRATELPDGEPTATLPVRSHLPN